MLAAAETTACSCGFRNTFICFKCEMSSALLLVVFFLLMSIQVLFVGIHGCLRWGPRYLGVEWPVGSLRASVSYGRLRRLSNLGRVCFFGTRKYAVLRCRFFLRSKAVGNKNGQHTSSFSAGSSCYGQGGCKDAEC